MNKTLKYCFLLLLCSVKSYSQSKPSYTPDVVPPSPNAASISKFGNIPVSYYTGTARVALPLYTVVEGPLQVPISMAYHPSGLRVAEEASQVGLGWALNAGGVISRTINGEDDFISGGYLSKTNSNALPPNHVPYNYIQTGYKTLIDGQTYPSGTNYFFEFKDPQFGTKVLFPLDCNESTPPARDYQPDSYSFSFPEGSGKFILTNTGQIITAEKTDLQIRKVSSTQPLIVLGGSVAWEIITPSGTKYLFDAKETFLPANDTYSGNYGKRVSSWYLKSITSATGQVINFTYNYMSDGNSCSQASIFEKRSVTSLALPLGRTSSCSAANSSTDLSIRYTQVVTLDKIMFSNGYLKFNFGNREDIIDDKKLESINIYAYDGANTSLFKTYEFGYDYFIGNQGAIVNAGCGSSNSKRLKLLSIDEKPAEGVGLRPYSFTYFEGNPNDLPAKTSYAVDHWGYFNGKVSNRSLIPSYTSIASNSTNVDDVVKDYYGFLTGAERETGRNFLKYFTLQKINYATGGYTQLDYEAHDYDVQNSKLKDHSFARTTTGGLESRNPIFSYNIQQKGVQQQYDIDLTNGINRNGNTSVSLNAYVGMVLRNSATLCRNVNGQDIYLEIVNKVTNQKVYGVYVLNTPPCDQTNNTLPCTDRSCSSQYAVPTIILKNNISLPVGQYTVKVTGADGTDFILNNLDLNFTWYEPKSVLPGAIDHAGGLRVTKLIDFDGTKSTVKNFSYRTIEQVGSTLVEKSTGRLMTMPQYTYCEPSWCDGPSGPNTTTCDNTLDIYRASSSIVPLNASASGSIVGYDKVTVTYGENGEFGKSVYIYDNQSDEVLDYGYFRPPTISSIPYNGNGNLREQQDYRLVDENYVKVQVIENIYYLNSLGGNPPNTRSFYGTDTRPLPIFRQDGTGCSILVYNQNARFFYPAIIQNINYLQSSKTKTYDTEDASNESYVEENSNNNYENQVYVQSTNDFTKTYLQPTSSTKINSKGEVILNEYKYPYNYTIAPYTTMVTKNIISPIIEAKVSLNSNQINKTLTNYQTFGSSHLPQSIQTQLKSTSPIITQVTFTSYDNSGNVTSFTERSGIVNNLTYYSTAGKINLLKQKTIGSGSIAQTTQYDYYPLKGVSKITDAAGLFMTYKYDGLGRLLDIKDNFGKLVKSYQYNYATPTAAGTAPAMAFSAQLDARNEQINLSFAYPTSSVEVVKYEIQRGQGNEPLKPWVTVDGDNTTKIDPSYTPNQNIYKYEIRAILSNGTATEWKPLNLNLPNNCTGKLQLIKNGVILATKPIVDKACYELILDEGFETQDNADYTGEIEN